MTEVVRVLQPQIEVSGGEVPTLLEQIRPQWRSKDLIRRVERLLSVDPSSACQRLLNAAVRDLRDKIQIAGLDIAGQLAAEHKFPAVTKSDDVENYSTFNIIGLSYRMGLLSRADWRRMNRAYEIRRDLEHEDSEYEAGVEDVLYVFKTCIDAVLSKDPITLIRVAEVKDIIQASSAVVPDTQLLDDFEHAPDTRQLEILKFLLSTALLEDQPDLVRQNANALMGRFSALARNPVLVALATHMQSVLGRGQLTEFHVRVAASARILPYLKKNQRRDFFASYADGMEQIGFGWRSHAQHGDLLQRFQEFGGLEAVPAALRDRFLRWFVLCYVGVPGGYGQGINRRVFYSNSAAPLIEAFFVAAPTWAFGSLESLRRDKDVKAAIKRDDSIARRFESLLDIAEV